MFFTRLYLDTQSKNFPIFSYFFYLCLQRSHPCILANFSDFNRQCAGKRIVVFLDYDGTLTPIVNDPDRAFLSPEMRETVSSVAKMFPTAIISGRGRDKVEKFVQLRDLYYAGSHGLDIKGPVVRPRRLPVQLLYQGVVRQVHLDELWDL